MADVGYIAATFWWIPGLITIAIIVAVALKKTTRKDSEHKHKWKPLDSINVKDSKGKDHLRLILVCEECGNAIHVPIYTIKQLARLG